MQIQITITGTFSDGQKFSYSTNDIEDAVREMEMIQVNEAAFDKPDQPNS